MTTRGRRVAARGIYYQGPGRASGERYFDGPRTLLAVGSRPRDGFVTRTNLAHTQPNRAAWGPTRPTATPFSNFDGPDWYPAFPPRIRLDKQTFSLLTAHTARCEGESCGV